MAILISSSLSLFCTLSLLLLQPVIFVNGVRVKILPVPPPPPPPKLLLPFPEAPAFWNGQECSRPQGAADKDMIHIVMPLDMIYIRGTVAAVLSILQHSMCPENVVFHFLSHHHEVEISSLMKSTFPYLSFKLYHFDSRRVHGKISKSVRKALDQPLNYARIYLSTLLPVHVKRVIYLDSDIVVVDDIAKLWDVQMDDKVLAAPEYCHANFTSYFTQEFWSDINLAATFKGKQPCYFNTGVMVVDVQKWRNGRYTQRVEGWMEIQKQRRIYHLGSLPPILLVFAGDIKAVDHRWNQHGLGGDNLQGKCRGLHPGPISLLHWSGKGKPWSRLDARRPCTVDYLWAPYDLQFSPRVALE